MPNHVYCKISTDKKQTLTTLHKLSKELNGGLANLIIPRPADQEDNWYSWNCDNWGNKWGFYDQEHTEGELSFTTAWAEPSNNLLDKIALHLPDMNFTYEEEQGWGGEIQYKNGEEISHDTYGIPPFDAEGWDIEESRYKRLAEDYTRWGITHKKGWYFEGELNVSTTPDVTPSKILRVEEY